MTEILLKLYPLTFYDSDVLKRVDFSEIISETTELVKNTFGNEMDGGKGRDRDRDQMEATENLYEWIYDKDNDNVFVGPYPASLMMKMFNEKKTIDSIKISPGTRDVISVVSSKAAELVEGIRKEFINDLDYVKFIRGYIELVPPSFQVFFKGRGLVAEIFDGTNLCVSRWIADGKFGMGSAATNLFFMLYRAINPKQFQFLKKYIENMIKLLNGPFDELIIPDSCEGTTITRYEIFRKMIMDEKIKQKYFKCKKL